MKKVIMLMLGLAAGTASFATGSTPQTTTAQSRLVMTPDYKIRLYVSPLPTKGELTIRDATGQAVYINTVALQKGLSQQFDLSNLGTGTYRLSLTTGSDTLSRTFVVQANPNESFVVQQS